MMSPLLFVAACFLAYSNGANDNFKGVASLFGSRTTGYPTAIGWATVTTFGGSICAIFLAKALLTAFSGRGLVPDRIVSSEYFLASGGARGGRYGHRRHCAWIPDFDYARVDGSDHRQRPSGGGRRGQLQRIG